MTRGCSAELLDRILTEHPEFEFVQIALNYLDWNSQFVQAGACYDVIRKHGKKVFIMEPVKGGGLSMVPEAVGKALCEKDPEASIASWAIRFAGSKDDILACLSGMSNMEQVKDNIHTYQQLSPLSEEEQKWLTEDIAGMYRAQGPCGNDFSKYQGLKLYGVDVPAILEAYNVCQLQPDPGFCCDNNYLLNQVAEKYHADFTQDLGRQSLIAPDGTDVTDEVYVAYDWLREHTF